jgi:hypothetical protein
MRPALLLAAAPAALAAHPATAQNVTATVTNQELQTLIPGNELTARDLYGRTYTDVFQADGSLYRSAVTTEASDYMAGHSNGMLNPRYVRDMGTWSIEENTLCRQLYTWTSRQLYTWTKGQKGCVRVIKAGGGYQLIHPSGRVEGVTFKIPHKEYRPS